MDRDMMMKTMVTEAGNCQEVCQEMGQLLLDIMNRPDSFDGVKSDEAVMTFTKNLVTARTALDDCRRMMNLRLPK